MCVLVGNAEAMIGRDSNIQSITHVTLTAIITISQRRHASAGKMQVLLSGGAFGYTGVRRSAVVKASMVEKSEMPHITRESNVTTWRARLPVVPRACRVYAPA